MNLVDDSKRIKSLAKNLNREYGFLIGIFAISFLLRVINVSRPTNTDESLWITRGIRFMNALLSGDLADTYTRHHPGITNMWVIGTAQLFSSWLHDVFPSLLGLEREPLFYICSQPPNNCAPLSLYVVSRILQAVITSGCMVLIYVLVKRLLSKAIAILTISFLLFEPFFLAYQRFITTDAFQVNFSVISILFLLLYLRESKFRELLLSGIFLGLAIASKVPALFVLPAIIIWLVLIELGWGKDRFPQRGWTRQFITLVILGGIALLTIFVIFPALWTSPVETLQTWYGGLQVEENRGNLFFMGETTNSPGLLFYPVVLLFRLSPLFQIGILAFSLALIVPKFRKNLTQISEILAIALVPIVVLSLLSLSSSKIDRYILLAIPELAIISAVGWLQVYSALKPYLGKIFSKKFYVAIAFIVLQAVSSVSYQPYYLSYFNPLLGGIKSAKNFILVGQGEGLDLAAKYLDKLPNADRLKVASWYTAPLDLYFSGENSSMNSAWTSSSKSNVINSNYIVLYINQFQRKLPNAEFLNYFSRQKPVFEWNKNKVRYVSVYPGITPTIEELEDIESPLNISWRDRVNLLGYEIDCSDIKDNKIAITFYWKFIDTVEPNTKLNISLTDGVNQVFSTSASSFIDGYLPFTKIPANKILRDVRILELDNTIQSGTYDLNIDWNFAGDMTNTKNNRAIAKVKL